MPVVSETSSNAPIRPVLTFDSSDFESKDQLDAFMPINGSQIVPPDRSGAFNVRMDGWLVEDYSYIRTVFKLEPHRRHHALVQYPDRGKLCLRKVIYADARGLFNGAPFEYRTGQIQIHPANCMLDLELTALAQFSIYLPYDRLKIDPGRARLVLEGNSPIGKIIGTAMDGAMECVAQGSVQRMRQAADVFCGMVNALVAKKPPETAHQAMDRARGLAIRSYILKNLCDPALSVDRICRNFAASRATIYREFNGDGGILRFIMNSRLDRAYRELAVRAPQRGSIVDTAWSCGFWDLPAFSRAFRNRFALAPSDVLGSKHDTRSASQIRPTAKDETQPSSVWDLLAA